MEIAARTDSDFAFEGIPPIEEVVTAHPAADAAAAPAVQPDPVQVWTFGRDLTLIALGGEVVVDYALRLRREYPDRPLWVAGYSNDVFGYVPSSRVLTEGGYEGGGAMIYYGRPGPFAPPVEDLIHDAVQRMLSRPR